MAEVILRLTVKKSWLLRCGYPGTFICLCLMKLGAPAGWFISFHAD